MVASVTRRLDSTRFWADNTYPAARIATIPQVPMKSTSNSAATLTQALKHEAFRLGFDLAGACPAVVPLDVERLHEWLALGRAADMHYMTRHADARCDPRHVLDGTRSILMLAVNYRTAEPVKPKPGQGRVSRYAWGADYHDVIRGRLRQLADFHRRLTPDAALRGVVDTAPLLERSFAQLAGLGWIGKNTMLINRRFGSWIFLAALLTSEALAYDEPHEQNYCGTCRACLEACPTGALVDAHQLDARKCISYLTIEHRRPIPPDLERSLSPWVFGCDICQEVCPWNRKTPVTSDPAFAPSEGMNPIDLAKLTTMDDATFRHRFSKRPFARPGREGLARNVAAVNRRTSKSHGGNAAVDNEQSADL